MNSDHLTGSEEITKHVRAFVAFCKSKPAEITCYEKWKEAWDAKCDHVGRALTKTPDLISDDELVALADLSDCHGNFSEELNPNATGPDYYGMGMYADVAHSISCCEIRDSAVREMRRRTTAMTVTRATRYPDVCSVCGLHTVGRSSFVIGAHGRVIVVGGIGLAMRRFVHALLPWRGRLFLVELPYCSGCRAGGHVFKVKHQDVVASSAQLDVQRVFARAVQP